MSHALGWWCMLASMAAVLGCSPYTAVKRTALIPAPTLPARVGAPLEHAQIRANAQIDALELLPSRGGYVTAEEGDPGVLVPDLHLGGNVYVGLVDVLEVGARVHYTHSDWADPNADGVLPLPDGASQGLWGGGLGGRLNFILGDHRHATFSLSFLGELNLTEVPEASFVRDGAADEDDPDLPSSQTTYTLDAVHEQLFLVPNAAAVLGAGGQWWYASLLTGVTTSVRNVGFDRLENLDKETLASFLVVYVGGGFEARFDAFVVGAHVYWPFESERLIRFAPRGQLQAGVLF